MILNCVRIAFGKINSKYLTQFCRLLNKNPTQTLLSCYAHLSSGCLYQFFSLSLPTVCILTHNNAVVLLLWDVWATRHAHFSVSTRGHAPKPTPQPISIAQPLPFHNTWFYRDVLLCKVVRLKYPPGNAALGRELPGPRDGQTEAGKRAVFESLLPVQTSRGKYFFTCSTLDVTSR